MTKSRPMQVRKPQDNRRDCACAVCRTPERGRGRHDMCDLCVVRLSRRRYARGANLRIGSSLNVNYLLNGAGGVWRANPIAHTLGNSSGRLRSFDQAKTRRHNISTTAAGQTAAVDFRTGDPRYALFWPRRSSSFALFITPGVSPARFLALESHAPSRY